MADQLEASLMIMDHETYKNLIKTKFNNIAAVPSIDAEMLRYLFTPEELQWLKQTRAT